MRFIPFICYFVLLALPAAAQQDNTVVQSLESMVGFGQQRSIINPGAFDFNEKFRSSILYKGYTGDFSEVNSLVWTGDYKIGEKQLAGALIQSQREGPHFRRSRIYGRYATTINLSDNWAAQAGAVFGMINISFGGISSQSSYSANGITSNLGIELHSKTLQLGGSVHQVFDQEITPFSARFSYKRHYYLYANYSIEVSPVWQLRSTSWYRIIPNNEHLITGGFSAHTENFFVGSGYLFRSWFLSNSIHEITALGGLKNLSVDKLKLSIAMGFHFFIPQQGAPATHQVEVNMNVRI